MAIAATTILEINSGATAANVNGGGFNPANAGMLTDGTVDAGTGNTASPIFSSVSYSFVAGDVGKFLYLKSGTSCYADTYYPIASVTGGKATLSAAVGAAETWVNTVCSPSIVAGIASIGTPTGITFTIDYSRGTSAIASLTDLVSVGSSTTLTSVAGLFTPVMVGNILHLNNAGTGSFGTVGFYEIATYVNTGQVTTDRTTNGGTAMAAGQGKIGGALSWGDSTDASVLISLGLSSTTAATRLFIKGGGLSYTPGATITGLVAGNTAWHFLIEGYGSARGDKPTGSNMPVINCGAAIFTFPANSNGFYLSFAGTADPVVQSGTGGVIAFCKSYNTSTSASRSAFVGNSTSSHIGCEAVSLRGRGISGSNLVLGCYIHDCDVGVRISGTTSTVVNNIVADCVTDGFIFSAAPTNPSPIIGNTFYGAENKLGIGISLPTGSHYVPIMNNIFYGFVTAISHADVNSSNYGNYNDFFNNTNDVNAAANWQKRSGDIAVNPSFTTVAQLTGTTATTTSGNHLVQSGATFVTSGVTPGRDFLHVKSGTSVTAGKYGILSVDSETQITTDIAITANATADKTWQITTGRNFAPTGVV